MRIYVSDDPAYGRGVLDGFYGEYRGKQSRIPPLQLMSASARLRERYVAGEIDLEELERLMGLALAYGDPMERVRPGGMGGGSGVEGEIEELGTVSTAVVP